VLGGDRLAHLTIDHLSERTVQFRCRFGQERPQHRGGKCWKEIEGMIDMHRCLEQRKWKIYGQI